jgi:beta-lactamase superfamily II metal-dependent hydrolase
MYFLDVGQGDAAFVVTPNNTKILVDGGLRDRALGFLIWKYRLDITGNTVTIDHLFSAFYLPKTL